MARLGLGDDARLRDVSAAAASWDEWSYPNQDLSSYEWSCNHESDADHDRMSTVMKRQPDGTWKPGWSPGDAPDWPFPRGSGGMVTTARDYALFCQMLLNRGVYDRKRILSEASVSEMTAPQSKRIAAAKTYGLGWVVSEPGGPFSHSGSDGTYVWVDPATEIIGMVLTQTN